MAKLRSRLSFIAAVLTLQFVLVMPSVRAQVNCVGKWERFNAYAGSYDTFAVLNDAEVHASIESLLGGESEHLLANLSTRGQADLIACYLVMEGNADHKGGEENGLLVIDIATGEVAAGILSAGKISIYTTADDYPSLPLPLKDWIAVVKSDFKFRFDPPDNFELISK